MYGFWPRVNDGKGNDRSNESAGMWWTGMCEAIDGRDGNWIQRVCRNEFGSCFRVRGDDAYIKSEKTRVDMRKRKHSGCFAFLIWVTGASSVSVKSWKTCVILFAIIEHFVHLKLTFINVTLNL